MFTRVLIHRVWSTVKFDSQWQFRFWLECLSTNEIEGVDKGDQWHLRYFLTTLRIMNFWSFGDDSWMCQRFCQLFLNRGFSRHFFVSTILFEHSICVSTIPLEPSTYESTLFELLRQLAFEPLTFALFGLFGAPFIFDIFPCFIYVGAPVSLHFFMILLCGAPKRAKLVYNSNN